MSSDQQSLSANKRALLKIRELKQQLAEKSDVSFEPIAVVSMACRFPRAASTPEKFWEQLISKESFVRDVPDDRWDPQAFFDEDPEIPGKMYTQKGVYLDDIDLMDPEFFGISPREATWVDPQQRLLMEVSWEAMERAGWIPEQIGDSTGVFVGWMHNDYQNEASDSFLNLNPYIATGAAGSFLCGRLAYYLGLHGPALAVDTACSSSLVALHLAIQSLQKKDCDRALVGGVNVICSPTTNILTCKLKALSPSGHSRAFDSGADGYLRGEGCGVVALRRLSDAQKDGDHVIGIIRGSAIGHNGFSSGLTAPNPKAQEMVIRQALDRAGLQPSDVDYLEAHGTGTELGDPLEIQAASAALCTERDQDQPLMVGSVKTNIGHLEAAAGMAGLIKVLLAMQHNQIPGQLNFDDPNPHIAWDKTAIRVLTEPAAWPSEDQRIAGVSAFGMSGTNAHVLLEAPETSSIDLAQSETTGRPCLLTISAKNEEALIGLSEKYLDRIWRSEDEEFNRICRASNLDRSHFEHRIAILARNREDATESLQQLVRGQQDDRSSIGQASKRFKLAWQFTGQGSQYPGMAKRLFDSEPVFRDAILECEEWLSEVRSQSLCHVLFEDPEQIHDTLWTQPGLFAIEMGIARLLNHWGVFPDIVLGHSVGQYAAACAAGVMSWQDGLRLISERGRLIAALPREGRMLAVFANRESIEDLVAEQPGLDFGAFNVSHVVVSGQEAAIDKLQEKLNQKGVRSKVLQTSHAFHSELMDPVLDEFANFAEQIQFGSSKVPLVCNLTGKVLAADFEFNGQYWAKHIRGAVQFQASLESIMDFKCNAILELGPKPVLSGMVQALNGQDKPLAISCLNDKLNEQESMLRSLGALYTSGLNPDFAELNPPGDSRCVDLPTYPFQKRRFWGPDKPRAAHAEHHTAHPLLGSKLSLANSAQQTRFENFVDTDSPAWMSDHQVLGATVFPGAAFVELAVEVTRQSGKSVELQNLQFERPLSVASRMALQTIVNPITPSEQDQEKSSPKFLECFSQANESSSWSRHFVVDHCVEVSDSAPARIDLRKIQEDCSESVDVEAFYQFLASIDLEYGQRFRTIESLSQSEESVLSKLVERADLKGYTVSPTLLDGAFHSLAVAISRSGDEMFLPVSLGSLRVFQPVRDEVWCHAKWTENEGKIRTADLTLVSEQGEVLLEIKQFKVQRIDRSTVRRATQTGRRQLTFDFQWRRSRLPGKRLEDKCFWIVGTSSAAQPEIKKLTELVKGRGHRCQTVGITEGKLELSKGVDEHLVLDVPDDGDLDWSACHKFLADKGAELPDGVIWVIDSSITPGPRTEFTETNTRGLVSLIQWLRRSNVRSLNAGIQLITANGVAVSSGSAAQVNPQQSQFWGLGRVLSAECPEFRCRLIDVGHSNQEVSHDAMLADALLTDCEENQVAIHEGDFLVPRIAGVQSNAESQSWIRQDACYLVTGGLGKLGRQAAKWLAENGAQQLVLVSRSKPDEDTNQFVSEIGELGAEVLVHNGDMANEADVNELFARFGSAYKPLAGIIHAAGILDDGLIDNQSWPRFEKVLRPKVDAAWYLHEASLSHQLDFFILYSSVASILGSPGQSNYAMGNAYLDGLAAYRRSQDLPALSINWGPWTEGMADDEKIKRRLAAQGITALEVKEAHAAMETALRSGASQCFVIDVDWRKLKLGADGKTPLILSELVTASQKANAGDSQLVAKLKKMAPAAQRELLITTVQKLFQDVLASDTAPEVDRPLIEMGLDSLMAVEFGTSLQQAFGGQFEIGPSLLFDHPTIESIAEYLSTLISVEGEAKEAKGDGNDAPPKQDAVHVQSDEALLREDIAIIGLSCRFPGARSAEEYWQNLLNGVDSVGEIPKDRWDVERFFSDEREPGKMYTREGGFLNDIGHFDAEFFGISDTEACWIDPQHRMLLENSYHALEDAGIPTKPLDDANIGVFMGIMGQDYAFLPSLEDREVIRGFEGAGLSHSAGVGRISYLLGLEGPSVAVDTASSSSLVAVIQAVRSLQERNCNLALAGGVNAILAPVNSLLMSKAGLLSPDGRCKSFSDQADGFGRGEGCGVVVLKRLSDAERDQDKVLAVIRGGAIGHNGFSGGLTTPSSKAQARVIGAAVRDAGISPSQVQYLEAHGTGTEFGDPIELAAAVQVYGKGRSKDKPLVVGSAKANIGHLEAAGGVSGLIKTVLSIHHGETPPQIHFESPSRHIPWSRMPVTVPKDRLDWKEEKLEYAAVTALGLAGTNAHLILSAPEGDSGTAQSMTIVEDDSKTHSSNNNDQHALFVSAKTAKSLTDLLRRFHEMLNQEAVDEVNWPSICAQAGVHRRHFDFRECVVASNAHDARLQLESLIQTRSEPNRTNGSTASQKEKDKLASLRNSIDKKLFYFPGDDKFSMDLLDELSSLNAAVGDLQKEFSDRMSKVYDSSPGKLSEQLAAVDAPGDDLLRFAAYASLATLWKSWGVEPEVVAGVGVGQLAAACVADMLGFADAFSILLFRSKLVDSQDWDQFEKQIDQFNYYPPNLSLLCTLSGEEIPVHKSLAGSYWREYFENGSGVAQMDFVQDLSEKDVVLNLGSAVDPSSQSGPWSACKASIFNSGVQNPGELKKNLLDILGRLYRCSLNPCFKALAKPEFSQKINLPVYPFDKKRFWITEISQYLPDEKSEQEAQGTTNV